jgi:hypothetical protein
MSWGRYDDNFADWPLWESVSYAARWHYIALVQTCCRLERWDGRLTLAAARRASDVGNADACHDELVGVDVVKVDGRELVLLRIDEHVPPPWVRKNAEDAKVRMRRMRKHRAGDHSECLPEKCPDASVTEIVTGNTGTGRDGPGRDGETNYSPTEGADDWPDQRLDVDPLTGGVDR